MIMMIEADTRSLQPKKTVSDYCKVSRYCSVLGMAVFENAREQHLNHSMSMSTS